MRDYRDVSYWFDSLAASGEDDLRPRPALRSDASADVCIVGAGLTGLWTAYYLAKADPSLRIIVLEREIAGFGASGRNGGWCSALFPKSAAALERIHGREAAVAMRRAMIDTVAEVGRVTEAEGIDCDFVRGGTVAFARDRVQWDAATADVAEAAALGVDPLELWDADSVRSRFAATANGGRDSAHESGAFGAVFDPSCARVHPAKLVRGLARVVEGLGVRIHEGTEVVDWESRRVRVRTTGAEGTESTVTAASVIIAVEGYGANLKRVKRRILPLYSLMVATEPLDPAVWDEIGIAHGQTFTDYRHLIVYGQRTADDRVAFGGRGARYHWGSTIREAYDQVDRVFEHLEAAMGDLFPPLRGAAISHRWGGPLGVPRDWHATASYNPATGVGYAGGYVGDGLSTTNLAGRTLGDLVLGRETETTRLPWVNHRPRPWEPEPLRFLGANAGLLGTAAADVEQRVTRRRSLAARVIGPLTGH